MVADVPCSAVSASRTTLSPGQAAAVRRAQAFIEQNLGEPLDVLQIAAAACVSRFYLARLFRSATGLSPMAWLRQRRIEQARRWLRDGAQPVGRIASDLGYFDQSHFTRSFRAATGCSPRRYARQLANAH